MPRLTLAVLNGVVVTGVILSSLVGFVAGCVPSGPRPEPRAAEGTEPVMLAVEHRSEWRVLWVEGETDLPDGAEVQYRTTHALARTAPTEEWPAGNLIASGRATVQDGTYWARINTLNWPRGEVQLVVQFPVPPQPAHVISRYGDFGEHLTGENVKDLDGLKVVEVEHVFEHTP